jgi:hypothetical protein
MHRNLVAVILILTSGLVTASQAAAPKTKPNNLILTIGVRNYANVDGETLEKAEGVATLIFRQAGVQTQWIDLEIPNDVDSSILQVQLIAGVMAERLNVPHNVMGLAPGNDRDRHFVYVLYDGVEALARAQKEAVLKGEVQRNANRAQILGILVAHEIGHLLLNLPSHSGAGIMRGDWNFKDLEDAAYGCLLFTRPQAESLQTEVASRAQQREVVKVGNQEQVQLQIGSTSNPVP